MRLFKYPAVRKSGHSDVIFGKNVADPYRWLEDPDSAETKKFVKEQNSVVQDYLGQSDIRNKFASNMTRLMDYAKYGCPKKEGDHYFHFFNSGLQPQSALYKQASLADKPSLFFDPNCLSEDGTVSINTYSFSNTGKYFGYALSNSGSDWVNIHVMEVATKLPVGCVLEWAKFTGIQWMHDDSGFFYGRYPSPVLDTDKGTETQSNLDATVWFHSLKTTQQEDILVYKPEDPSHRASAQVTDDGKYLLMGVSQSCDPKNLLFVYDLGLGIHKEMKFTTIVDVFKASFEYISNEGPVFWFETTLNAPLKRIVKYDVSNTSVGFVEVIPESPHVVDFVTLFGSDKLVVVTLEDVKHVAKIYNIHSAKVVGTLPLPNGSIINSISAKREHNEMFYSYSSYATPGQIMRFDATNMKSEVYRDTEFRGFNPSDIVTTQVFFPSKDGTLIPMYLIHKIDTVIDAGTAPVLLYGYGGFNISITPSFSVAWSIFMCNFKGVVAIANIRGGGEYGEKWYEAGRLNEKQNVFDDFQYAAKYLVAKKYTNPSKLCLNGGSNGGLLVGACINQAPTLFGCGVAEVGVLDMLRFHKFTIGHAWTSDYGDPDTEPGFNEVFKYSPLHNVGKHDDTKCPAVLILTGDHDDRVVPLHSLKYLAALQAFYGNVEGAPPLMGRINTKAGHGAGKSTQQRIEETADKFAFISIALGIEWVD